MSKTSETDNFDDYAPVADRIALFYRRFPLGRVITRFGGAHGRRGYCAGVGLPIADREATIRDAPRTR